PRRVTIPPWTPTAIRVGIVDPGVARELSAYIGFQPPVADVHRHHDPDASGAPSSDAASPPISRRKPPSTATNGPASSDVATDAATRPTAIPPQPRSGSANIATRLYTRMPEPATAATMPPRHSLPGPSRSETTPITAPPTSSHAARFRTCHSEKPLET